MLPPLEIIYRIQRLFRGTINQALESNGPKARHCLLADRANELIQGRLHLLLSAVGTKLPVPACSVMAKHGNRCMQILLLSNWWSSKNPGLISFIRTGGNTEGRRRQQATVSAGETLAEVTRSSSRCQRQTCLSAGEQEQLL